MPFWGWIVLAVVAVVLVTAAAIWFIAAKRRTDTLRERFGPEYERTLRKHPTRREGEAELSQRLRRRERLPIRPLDPAKRKRYLDGWHDVQAQFVDGPDAAVASAHTLVRSAMSDRGYPMEDFEQRAADVSVDHPVVVEEYRRANEIAARSARGEASTEELRQAMQHYRALFDELLESGEHETTENTADDDYRERVTRGG